MYMQENIAVSLPLSLNLSLSLSLSLSHFLTVTLSLAFSSYSHSLSVPLTLSLSLSLSLSLPLSHLPFLYHSLTLIPSLYPALYSYRYLSHFFVFFHRRVQPKLPNHKDIDPLLEIDRNPRKLEIFLTNHMPILTVGDMRRFLPCTINVDPYLRKLIRGIKDKRNLR